MYVEDLWGEKNSHFHFDLNIFADAKSNQSLFCLLLSGSRHRKSPWCYHCTIPDFLLASLGDTGHKQTPRQPNGTTDLVSDWRAAAWSRRLILC